MNKIIRLASEDHTDILINADRVLFVGEETDGCMLVFGNQLYVHTSATIDEVQRALEAEVTSNDR